MFFWTKAIQHLIPGGGEREGREGGKADAGVCFSVQKYSTSNTRRGREGGREGGQMQVFVFLHKSIQHLIPGKGRKGGGEGGRAYAGVCFSVQRIQHLIPGKGRKGGGGGRGEGRGRCLFFCTKLFNI